MKKLNLILVFICAVVVLMFSVVEKCDGLIKRSEYNKMPRVFEFDHYDDCLYTDPEVGATYCLVRVVIKPDNGSELWRLIEDFSNQNRKMHLNHASLERGICIQSVEALMAKFSNENISDFVVPKFDINFPYTFKYDPYRNVDEYKKNYSQIVSIVINKDLTERYGLKAYTEIEYCDRTNVNEFPIDYLDICFLVIVATLIALTMLSSYFDYTCKTTSGLDHYRQEMPSRKSMILASFSIIRNWYRLLSHSRDPLNRDLRVIQATRYFSFNLILIGHVALLVLPRTAWNIEQLYRQLPTMIVINGIQIVTTFFGISALVFTITFVGKMRETGRKPGLLEIVLVTFGRYVRLTPVYALVLLFEATWAIRLQDGPFWRRGMETDLTYCRRNWWTNLLYVNNYVRVDQPCMLHSWYLACDFQLSIVALVIVTLVLRIPKLKVPLLSIATIAALVIPGYVVYQNGLEGVTIFSPESRRFFFWYDDHYLKTYLPTHMNLSMSIFGITIGLLYWRLKRNSFNPTSNLFFKTGWYSLFIIGPGMFLVGRIFYVNDFSKPSLWMAIYFSASRLMWGALLIVAFLGALYRVNKQVVRLLNLRYFEVFGRLTYGAYVCHFFIIKMMFYNTRELSNMGVFDLSVKVNSTIYTAFLLSIVLAFLVELPISALQKQLLEVVLKAPKRIQSSDSEATQNERGEVKREDLNGFVNEAFRSSVKVSNGECYRQHCDIVSSDQTQNDSH